MRKQEYECWLRDESEDCPTYFKYSGDLYYANAQHGEQPKGYHCAMAQNFKHYLRVIQANAELWTAEGCSALQWLEAQEELQEAIEQMDELPF